MIQFCASEESGPLVKKLTIQVLQAEVAAAPFSRETAISFMQLVYVFVPSVTQSWSTGKRLSAPKTPITFPLYGMFTIVV